MPGDAEREVSVVRVLDEVSDVGCEVSAVRVLDEASAEDEETLYKTA